MALSRIILAALLALTPFAASAATLTVKLDNIDKKGGILRLSLYDEVSWSKDGAQPAASADVPAVAPGTTVILKDLPPGVYGVKTYQDANGNGKFDQNWLGLPEERYGFSNNASPVLSEPGFDKTKFALHDGDNEISIRLQ
jgi:uncharacterized protein (DUF2141 family)